MAFPRPFWERFGGTTDGSENNEASALGNAQGYSTVESVHCYQTEDERGQPVRKCERIRRKLRQRLGEEPEEIESTREHTDSPGHDTDSDPTMMAPRMVPSGDMFGMFNLAEQIEKELSSLGFFADSGDDSTDADAGAPSHPHAEFRGHTPKHDGIFSFIPGLSILHRFLQPHQSDNRDTYPHEHSNAPKPPTAPDLSSRIREV